MARKKRRQSSKKQPSRPVDYWEKLSKSRQHTILLVFLFVLPVFMFHETILGGYQYFAHDTLQWRAGAESAIEHRENQGEEPLWITSMFAGMPSYMVTYAKAVPHLDDLVYNSLRPIFPAAPFWVLLGGSYLFLWLMGFRPLVAALGSVIVSFTTYIPIIIGAGHNTKFLTYSFIPWMMVGYWTISRTNRIWLGFFALTLATTLVLRANHPQVLYFFFFLLLIWWIVDLVQAWKSSEISPFGKKTALIAAAGILALGANIQPYWSTFEYADYSTRGGSEIEANDTDRSGLDPDYAFAWSQGPSELLTLIIPESFGGSSADGAYWGPKTFTSGPHYFGAVTILLVLIALFHVRSRVMYVFLGTGILTLLFSLGKYLEWFNLLFFNYFPFFNRFRVPEMWLMVVVFSFAVVALYGLHWLYEQYESGNLNLKAFYAPGGIVLAFALIFAVGSGQILSFEKEGEREQIAMQIAQQHQADPNSREVQQAVERVLTQQFIPEREERAANDSRRFLIFILIATGLIAAVLYGKLPVSYAVAGILVITAVDLIQVGLRYADKESLISGDIERTQVIEDRITSADEYIIDHTETDEPWKYRGYPHGNSPFNNAVPESYAYESIGGYSGAKLQNFQDLIDYVINEDPQRAPVPVLSMLNVKYITARQQLQDPALQPVHQDQEAGIVYENTDVLPKAFFVDEVEYADSPRDAVNTLNRQDFDPSTQAILQTENEISIDPEANPSVTVTRYDNRNIAMDIESDGDAFMVLSEIYYPAGWEASLNGEPIDIERTNFLLRGFQIPEGSHELTLRMDPRSHVLGSQLAWVFNIIILLIGLGVIYHEWRRRQTGESVSDS